MDGRVVGRGGLALRLHVVEKGRALPLAWRVRHSPTGHGPETLPLEVVALMSRRSPAGAQVVLRGDGACDGTARPRTLRARGWSYGCRPAMRTTATWNGHTLRLATVGAWRKPGRRSACQDVQCPRDA